MAEPFKNVFNPKMIALMGDILKANCQAFDLEAFVSSAAQGLEQLELKERSSQITDALKIALPADYRSACEVMLASLHPNEDVDLSKVGIERAGIRGWAVNPMADYIAQNGIDDFDFSMDVLKEMTKRFTGEFAVRHFFLTDTSRALGHAQRWALDTNYHVRRLASEGTRPLLPWGVRLPPFVEDPKPLMPILEPLKDDKEEYVRRSVANNLNDISKDHPDLVAKIAKGWLRGASKERQRLVKHACRTLIKRGYKPTLSALGYGQPKVKMLPLKILTPVVQLGEFLEFEISLTSESKVAQPLLIDFIIQFQKSNGSLSPKVFKWKILELTSGEKITLSKKHPIKPITTRVYYPGLHEIEIQINGKTFGKAEFDLTV